MVHQALRGTRFFVDQAFLFGTNSAPTMAFGASTSQGPELTRRFIVHRIDEIKSLHVAMVRKERLASAIVGRHAAEEHLAEAKEALRNADICEKVANGEVAMLEQLLKELET